ncbi:hypothetical protein BX600DRAFT_476243 [Xylariales sp. PMI_506]|nr:hypothetical protein BX600DRAFT_476243 [Xylariales sp. PMI_506]
MCETGLSAVGYFALFLFRFPIPRWMRSRSRPQLFYIANRSWLLRTRAPPTPSPPGEFFFLLKRAKRARQGAITGSVSRKANPQRGRARAHSIEGWPPTLPFQMRQPSLLGCPAKCQHQNPPSAQGWLLSYTLPEALLFISRPSYLCYHSAS